MGGLLFVSDEVDINWQGSSSILKDKVYITYHYTNMTNSRQRLSLRNRYDGNIPSENVIRDALLIRPGPGYLWGSHALGGYEIASSYFI